MLYPVECCGGISCGFWSKISGRLAISSLVVLLGPLPPPPAKMSGVVLWMVRDMWPVTLTGPANSLPTIRHLSEAILDHSTARRHVAKSGCLRAQRHWSSCPDQEDCSTYTQNHELNKSYSLKWLHLGVICFIAKANWYRLVDRIHN